MSAGDGCRFPGGELRKGMLVAAGPYSGLRPAGEQEEPRLCEPGQTPQHHTVWPGSPLYLLKDDFGQKMQNGR